MTGQPRDAGLDALLDLDGLVFFVDDKAKHWVKFEVRRIEPSSERPHGLRYSLTLHDANGERLVGFDNAHPARSALSRTADHRHRFRTIRAYDYTSAAQLLVDFWAEVDSVLKERGG